MTAAAGRATGPATVLGLGAGAVAASGPALAAQQAVGDVALQTFNLPDGFVFAEMGIALGVMLLAFRLGATLYR